MGSNYKSSLKLINFYKKIEKRHLKFKEYQIENYLKESMINLENTINQLDALTTITAMSKFNEMYKIIKDKKSEFGKLYSDLDKPISIYIIGENGLGKSTLTNALIATNSFVPGNNTIDIYRARSKVNDKVEIIRNGSESVELGFNETLEYINNVKLKNVESINLLNRNNVRKQSKYENNENALNELQSIYKREILKFTNDIAEVRWPIKDSDLLNKFTIVDTGEIPEYASNLYYNSDCILYMINTDELYLQENPDMIEYVKNKKVIAVINRVDELVNNIGDIGINRYIKDVKALYGNKVNAVVAISAKNAVTGIQQDDLELQNDSGISHLEQVIESYFSKNLRMIKIDAKKQGAAVLLSELTKNIQMFTKELKENDSKKAVLRYDFRELMLKETTVIKIKADWFLNTYEMNTKNHIKVKLNTLFDIDSSEAKKYIENDIFNINEFQMGLTRLKDDIVLLMQKFYSKNLSEYRFSKYKYLDEEEIRLSEKDFTSQVYLKEDKDLIFLSALDVNQTKIIDSKDISHACEMMMGKVIFRLPFTKKKKMSKMQTELIEILENKVNEQKKVLYLAIDESFNDIYLRVYQNIEDSFVEHYCHGTLVNKSIRVLDNLIRAMALPSMDLSVKDIIIGKSKLSQ